jgi:hypothetical protein
MIDKDMPSPDILRSNTEQHQQSGAAMEQAIMADAIASSRHDHTCQQQLDRWNATCAVGKSQHVTTTQRDSGACTAQQCMLCKS